METTLPIDKPCLLPLDTGKFCDHYKDGKCSHEQPWFQDVHVGGVKKEVICWTGHIKVEFK
jgi:hypothetical protein